MAPTAVDDEIDFQPAKQAAPPVARNTSAPPADDDQIDFKVSTPSDIDFQPAKSAAPRVPLTPPRAAPTPTPTLAERVGSLIPDAAMPALTTAKKYLVDPFEKMVQKGSELGGEAARLPIETATAIQQLPQTVQGITPFAPSPLTTTPETSGTEPLLDAAKQAHPIATGVSTALGETAGGLAADPRMWALSLGNVGSAAIQKMIAGGFSLQMLYGAAQNVPGIADALKAGNTYEATRLLTSTGLQAVMGAAGAKHALSGKAAPVETAEPSTPEVGAGSEKLAPEAPETLKAQTDALANGTNPVVYFPKGSESIPEPPENAKVTVVGGDKAGAGTYYHDDSVTPEDIQKAVKDGTHGQLLGHEQTKEEAVSGTTAPVAVVSRDTQSGSENKASVVNASDEKASTAQAATLQAQFPDSQVTTEPAENIINERRQAAGASPTGQERRYTAADIPALVDKLEPQGAKALREARAGGAQNVSGKIADDAVIPPRTTPTREVPPDLDEMASHISDVETRIGRGEQIPMADVDRLHSMADEVENGSNGNEVRDTGSSAPSAEQGEERTGEGTTAAATNAPDTTERAAASEGPATTEATGAEVPAGEGAKTAKPEVNDTENAVPAKGPEGIESAKGPTEDLDNVDFQKNTSVGDRVNITGEGKLSGLSAEVTKVENNGVFVKPDEGPVKFIKNGEFEKPTAESASYSHPAAAILHQLGEWFRRDPASIKEQAKANLREKLGGYSHEMEKTIAALDKARDSWNGRTRQEALDFIDAIETGKTQGLKPADRQMAQDLTKELNSARDDVRALGVGALDNYIENYFPHIWKQPGPAREILAQIAAKRPLGGSKSFLKARTIPTTADGVAYGLEPITTNPVDLALMKIADMRKFKLSEDMKKEAVQRGTVLMAKDRRDLYTQLNQRAGLPAGAANSQDWVEINRWKGDSKEAWAPREVANVLNNYLEPGLRGRPDALGKGYAILRNASDYARFMQLGFSAFHLGSEAINTTVSSNALAVGNIVETLKRAARGDISGAKDTLGRGAMQFVRFPLATPLDIRAGMRLSQEFLKPGSYKDYADSANALETVNGRVRTDFQYRDKFLNAYRDAARKGSKLGMATNGLMVALEAPTKFVMQAATYMKLGSWHQMATDVLKRAGEENWADDQKRFELQKAYDSIENRFGQVNYDNLNMSRLTKDVLQLGVRSVGWTGGTLREGLGALGDTGRFMKGEDFSHRMGYALALPLTVGMMGALYTYLHTGQKPEGKDYFYPRTGRTLPNGEVERVSFPSYMKDVYSYITHPQTTLQNKLSPLISSAAELMQNKDYQGNKIYEEDDESNRQIADVAKYMVKQMVPFSVRNVQQRGESGGSTAQKTERGVETALGITPANKEVSRTDAENIMTKFQRDAAPAGGRTREAQQKRDAYQGLRKDFENGKIDKPGLGRAIKDGQITLAEAKNIVRGTTESYLQRGVQHLNLAQTLKLWDVANDDEKKILKPAIQKKAKPEALAGLSKDDKDLTIKKVRAILGNQPLPAKPGNPLSVLTMARAPLAPPK